MIAILSYGLGNIRAFANIYDELGIPFSIAEDAAALRAADHIILPGVGAFDYAMARLNGSGMRDALEEQVRGRGKPVLGVCVGMQMLARDSEEGASPGLGWIAGSVRRIRFPVQTPITLLPHMGWNTIDVNMDEPMLAGLDQRQGFYFLHSYYFECDQVSSGIARVEYGFNFDCAVRNGNVYGVQFHPEKSHRNGMRLLKNFAEL